MPRTFLVERIMDMSSTVKDTETKFKVTDDVTLDDGSRELMDEEPERLGDHEMQQIDEQRTMTSDQQRNVAMETSVIDNRARPGGKSWLTVVYHALLQPLLIVICIVGIGDAVSLLAGQQTCNSQIAGSSPSWTPLRSGLGQATYIHLCASVTKQYNLVPAKRLINI